MVRTTDIPKYARKINSKDYKITEENHMHLYISIGLDYIQI